MTITLESLGFTDVPQTMTAQLVEFKKLGAEYSCECVNVTPDVSCLLATWQGDVDNLKRLIIDCYAGDDIDEWLEEYGVAQLEELDEE